MRIVIWALVGLNAIAAVLVAAGFALPAASPPEPPGPAPSATRLELLSELPSPPARLDELAEAAPPLGDSPGFPDATPSEPASPPEAPATAKLAAGSEPPPLAQSPGSAPKPDPKADAPAPVADSKPASPSAPASALPDQNAPACFRTAEFAPDAKPRIEGSLHAAGFEQVAVRSTNRARYWVYWSGERGAADGIEQALRAAGVKDWYRAGGGAGATISLGVYGQADGARLRQRQLAAKGVEADIAERYPPQARLRLQITAPPSAVEAAMGGLTRDGVRLEPCP